jgi:hypothetical protein
MTATERHSAPRRAVSARSLRDPAPPLEDAADFPVPLSLHVGAPSDDGLNAVFERVAAAFSPQLPSWPDAGEPKATMVESIIRQFEAFVRARATAVPGPEDERGTDADGRPPVTAPRPSESEAAQRRTERSRRSPHGDQPDVRWPPTDWGRERPASQR